MPARSAEVTLNSDANADEHRDVYSYNHKELLKNWTFTTCMALMVHTDEAQDAMSKAASEYEEVINTSLNDLRMLEKLAFKYVGLRYLPYVQAVYPGEFFPGNLNAQKCINLYHSKELDDLVKKITKKYPDRDKSNSSKQN
jgi:uncharacterized protein YdiU (UPF0061 family)